MTPQRSVARVSHHRNASRSSSVPAGRFIGGQEALDAAQPAGAEMLGRAEAPGPDAEPGQVLVHLADVHQLPVQHGREPGFVDDQVAHPEVAVHQPRGDGGGRFAASQRNAHSNVAVVSPISSSRSRHSVSWSASVRPDAVRIGAVDGGQRLRALLQQPFAAGVVESAVDPPDDRLAADRLADQIRIAQCRRGIVGGQDVGDGCTRGGRALLDAGLQLHARVHVVGRAGAQDQRLPLRRSTASNAHVVRLAPPVSARRFSTTTSSPSTGRSTASSSFLHLRPNPKSRWATRRIWISSAPSVIR